MLSQLLSTHAAPTSQSADAPANPQIEDLGNNRYRIGTIHIDRKRGNFTVAATVLRLEPPIEFLLGTQGGMKNYETVLEAKASAHEFNLACILIGLNPQHADLSPELLSSEKPMIGDPVDISVSWGNDTNKITVPASQILLSGDPLKPITQNEWVYTGSFIQYDGQYVAELSGTLIGMVRRSETVIEHKSGIGIGYYGSITVNKDMLPGVGDAVEVTITRLPNSSQ